MNVSRALLLCFALFPLACSKSGEGPGHPARPPIPNHPPSIYKFQLIDARWPDRPFEIEMPVTNVRGMETLSHYLKDGAVAKDPNGNAIIGIVTGNVVASTATDTHRWAYHLDPDTISFSDMTTEVCDGTLQYVEEHLTEWIADVKTYCPWATASLIRRITKDGVELFRKE